MGFPQLKMKRKEVIFVLALLLLGGVFVILNSQKISAADVSYCAERTTSGAWCQNVPQSEVDTNYRSAPTSCESVAYCKLGTCVDSQQGLCSGSTPQRVCQENNGQWFAQPEDELPQCQLGCCLIGNGASFVTQTRCKALAADYGVETNYRSDVKTETACIALSNSQEEGACVFDDDFQRTCRRTTKADCQQLESSSGNQSVEFHEGVLCSSENLATNCGPSKQTTCNPDKDGVYFVDTCGNIANIYDASKINDKEYWTNIKDTSESCNPDSNNAGSSSCGNCNYIGGSTCKSYDRTDAGESRPSYGDFVCADLGCRFEGKTYQHGETWCADSPGIDENLPGSENYRLTCYNGDVTVEECASFRQEVCLQDDIEGFSVAACRVNRWQDCVAQDNKKDCQNIDKRDCQWVVGQTLTSLYQDGDGKPFQVNSDGELVQSSEANTGKGAACLPLNPPGFDFWNSEGDAQELCAIASDTRVVKFEKGLFGSYECKENCDAVGLKKGDEYSDINKKSQWSKDKENLCLALGDCGLSKNYLGFEGYNNDSTVKITSRNSDDTKTN